MSRGMSSLAFRVSCKSGRRLEIRLSYQLTTAKRVSTCALFGHLYEATTP